EMLGNFKRSKERFQKSSIKLSMISAHKKSLKAKLNELAAESKIYPEKKLITDYFLLAKRSLALRESNVAATAFLNISREYQKLGCYLAALRYANRSIRLLGRDFGTLTYYSALVHRAHLFYQLNRPKDAALDYQAAL